MQRQVTTTDGLRVMVHPHATPNSPAFGGKDGIKDDSYERRTFAHQDRILKIIDDNDLWQYMDEPGEMLRQFADIRKADPNMPILLKLVRLGIAGKLPSHLDPRFADIVPEELRSWPFPGPIRYKQGAENVDWIINEEAASVYVLALENTCEDPFDPEHKEFEKMKGLTLAERRELAADSFVKYDRGDNAKGIIGPGNAVAFTLLEDPMLARGFPNTIVTKYQHNNPMHNPGIRAGQGYARMDAYLGGSGEKAPRPAVKAKVMTSAKK